MADYPEDDTLTAIETFEFVSQASVETFLGLLKAAWNHNYGKYIRSEGGDDTLTLITGGWSGNEDIISALQTNFVFWQVCWKLSKRGGLFEFDLGNILSDKYWAKG